MPSRIDGVRSCDEFENCGQQWKEAGKCVLETGGYGSLVPSMSAKNNQAMPGICLSHPGSKDIRAQWLNIGS